MGDSAIKTRRPYLSAPNFIMSLSVLRRQRGANAEVKKHNQALSSDGRPSFSLRYRKHPFTTQQGKKTLSGGSREGTGNSANNGTLYLRGREPNSFTEELLSRNGASPD